VRFALVGEGAVADGEADGRPRWDRIGLPEWALALGKRRKTGPAHDCCPDLGHAFFIGFPRAETDNVAETGPVVLP